MSYWVGVTSAPGIMTSRPELQVETGNDASADVAIGCDEAALPGRKCCQCWSVVIIDLVTFTDLSAHQQSWYIREHDCHIKW